MSDWFGLAVAVLVLETERITVLSAVEKIPLSVLFRSFGKDRKPSDDHKRQAVLNQMALYRAGSTPGRTQIQALGSQKNAKPVSIWKSLNWARGHASI